MSDASASAHDLATAELDLARNALSRSDIAHAAVHVAQAIAADPTLSDGYELLEYLYAMADDPDHLFPELRSGRSDRFIGDLAARAHLRARAGDPDTALADLTTAAAAEPTKPWMGGGALALPEVRARLDSQRTGRSLSNLALALPRSLDARSRAALQPFLDLAHAVADAHPRDIELAVRLSGLARALDRDADADAWCARAESMTPGPLGTIMLGYALRDAQRFREMEIVWARAIEADPDNLDVYIDLAATLIEQDRRPDGERWLARALDRDPACARARALRYSLRFLDSDDVAHLIALADEAHDRDDAGTDTMLGFMAFACATRTWLNRVPMPTETVTQFANWIARERAEGKRVQSARAIGITIEPPSAVTALLAAVPGARAEVMSCPTPDLRVPLTDGAHRVWRYDGGTAPIPAMPKPSDVATALLRDVANMPWSDPISGYHQAARFAGTPIQDLLGLLCHIPPPPANPRWEQLAKSTPTYWPRLAQPWICLGILHHRADEPWSRSTRRQVLLDLVNGIEDWTVDAALFALVAAAWVDPDVRIDVLEIVRCRLDAARSTAGRRVMTIAPSIGELMLVTPGASAADLKRARHLMRLADRPTSSRIIDRWRRLWTRPARWVLP